MMANINKEGLSQAQCHAGAQGMVSGVGRTVHPAGVKKSKKNFQKFWYHGIVNHYFAYNSGGKLKSYHVSLLRYGNPDIHFMGSLRNKLQIGQKYDPSHHEFMA